MTTSTPEQETLPFEAQTNDQATPEQEGDAEEPDWKARYEAELAAHEATKQRERSRDGNIRKQSERDAIAERALREAEKTRKYVELMLERQPDSDPEEFRQRLNEISAEDARTEFRQVVLDMASDMNEMVETVGLPKDHPDVVEASRLFNEGQKSPNGIGMLIRAQKLLNKAASEKSKADEAEAIKKAREEGEREGRQRGRRADETDVSMPRGAGGGSPSNEDIWRAYGRGERPWDARVREAGKALGMAD